MISLITLFLLFTVAICLYDRSLKKTRVWKMVMNQFPGEPSLPLVGNLLQLGTSPAAAERNLHSMWKKHGMTNFRVVLGTELILMLSEAEDVKIILSSHTEIQKADMQIKYISEHFGNCLVNSSGDHWRTMRKILSQSFNSKLLEHHLDKANSEADSLIEVFKNYLDQPAVDIYHDVEWCTLNIIMSSAMGIESGYADPDKLKYVEASRRLAPLYIKRMYSTFYQNDFFYKHSALGREGENIRLQLEQSVNSIINRRKIYFKNNFLPLMEASQSVEDFISRNRAQMSIIDILLLSKMPDGSPIPDRVIREETNIMIFAGYETTVTTAAFALSNFAKYKDLQDKAYQEQLDIFGRDLDRQPTLQDLNNMRYLKRFIEESLRLYPTASMFARHVNRDVYLHDGKVIPGGTNVMFYIPGLHTNPNYFKEPKIFDPDRFLEPIKPCSFIPFSAGPRICIGMNFAWMTLRSILSKILRHYELSLEHPDHEPKPVNQFILTSTNGHRIKFTNRKTNQ